MTAAGSTEELGFEPRRPLRAYQFSRLTQSTTLPLLRASGQYSRWGGVVPSRRRRGQEAFDRLPYLTWMRLQEQVWAVRAIGGDVGADALHFRLFTQRDHVVLSPVDRQDRRSA